MPNKKEIKAFIKGAKWAFEEIYLEEHYKNYEYHHTSKEWPWSDNEIEKQFLIAATEILGIKQ